MLRLMKLLYHTAPTIIQGLSQPVYPKGDGAARSLRITSVHDEMKTRCSKRKGKAVMARECL